MSSLVCNETNAQTSATPGDLTLWHTQPATEWSEALPIGNGRLAAMVYGDIDQEHLQLKEETLWSGGPHNYDNPDAYKHLEKVRDFLKQEKYLEAEEIAEKMMGTPKFQMAYQLLGDLYLTFPKGEKSNNYRRKLDMQTAITTVSYTVGEAHFTRKTLASHPIRLL